VVLGGTTIQPHNSITAQAGTVQHLRRKLMCSQRARVQSPVAETPAAVLQALNGRQVYGMPCISYELRMRQSQGLDSPSLK
jgi:hypothetical protein